MAAGRHAANEHAGVLCVGLHAHTIAEHCAAAERAGGIDGKNTNAVSGFAPPGDEAVDQRALPAPGAPVTPTRKARPDRWNSSRTSAGPSAGSFSTRDMPRQSRADRRRGSIQRERTTDGIYHAAPGQKFKDGASNATRLMRTRTGYNATTMKMRLAAFALAVLAATPSVARADATAFLGRNSADDKRALTRGFAFGVSLLVVGFEFEYANSSENTDRSAPVAADDIRKRLPTDVRAARISAVCHDRWLECIASGWKRSGDGSPSEQRRRDQDQRCGPACAHASTTVSSA